MTKQNGSLLKNSTSTLKVTILILDDFRLIKTGGCLVVLHKDKLVRIGGRVFFTNVPNLLIAAREAQQPNNPTTQEKYKTGGVEIHKTSETFGVDVDGEVLVTFDSMTELISKYPEFSI